MSDLPACPCCGNKVYEMGECVLCDSEDAECGYAANIVSHRRLCVQKDEVERLKAVFHVAEGVLSGLEYLPLEHGSLLHRTLKETVYEYRKLMEKRKEGGR